MAGAFIWPHMPASSASTPCPPGSPPGPHPRTTLPVQTMNLRPPYTSTPSLFLPSGHTPRTHMCQPHPPTLLSTYAPTPANAASTRLNRPRTSPLCPSRTSKSTHTSPSPSSINTPSPTNRESDNHRVTASSNPIRSAPGPTIPPHVHGLFCSSATAHTCRPRSNPKMLSVSPPGLHRCSTHPSTSPPIMTRNTPTKEGNCFPITTLVHTARAQAQKEPSPFQAAMVPPGTSARTGRTKKNPARFPTNTLCTPLQPPRSARSPPEAKCK